MENYIVPDFQQLFESSPALYLVLSPDFKIVAVSNAYLQATLTIREEILGKGIFDVFPDNPNDYGATGVNNLRASLNRVLQLKTPDAMAVQKYDIPLPESQGGGFEVRYWSPLNSPVLGDANELKYIIHRVEDVSEFVYLKQREHEFDRLTEELAESKSSEKEYLKNLRESEEQLRLLLENISDYAIVMLDATGHVVNWTQGAEHIKGYTTKEIIGKHISVFYMQQDVQRGEPEYNLSMARERGRFESEGWRLRKDGSKFWADVIYTVLFNESGNVRGFVKVTRDITSRKEAEDLLKKSNENFFRIFNLSPEAKVISEVQSGRFKYVNNAFTKLLGIEEKEAVGKTSVELNMVSQEERNNYVKRIKEGRNKSIEIKLRTATGELKDILYTSDIAELDNMEYFFTTYLDITERKNTEERIAELNKNLEQNITQLESANKELESFSYSISHDLRAPLRAINGFARVLQEDYFDKIDEEGKRSLERIRNNANRMGQLIDDLLNFSRIGRKELQKVNVNMTDLVKTIVREQNDQFANRDVNFTINSLNSSIADPNLIKQVWENLIANAIKYTRIKEKASIEIGSYKKDSKVVYYIKDNGAGFDMKYADKLFGVFQRLHKDKEFEGTGVGLAIVHRIVAKHEGMVWAESEINKGASFYFALPDLIESN